MVALSFFVFLLSLSVLYFVLTFNPVEAVLWLMLIFALFAVLLFFFNQEFLGLSLILLYVSAVVVLFLYIVLILPSSRNKQFNFPAFSFLWLILFYTLLFRFLSWNPNDFSFYNFDFFFVFDFYSAFEAFSGVALQFLGLSMYFSYFYLLLIVTLFFYIALLGILFILYYAK